MKRVIISVTNDLVTDQRIHKVASTFMKAGYVPVLVGRLLKNSLIIERPYPAVRMKLIFKKGPFFYLEYNIRLFFFLLFTKATIFLSNDLDTLPANYLAAVIKKKKLIYDSHELFTEVPELVNRPSAKQFWSTIESWILPRIRLAMTVSQSISDFYQQKYGIKMAVVRNLPVEKQKIQSGQNPFNEFLPKKIIIYQGALNMARGIEQVIEAMQFIENAMFVIVGEGDITNQLKEQTVKLKLNKKIIFLGKISFELLFEYTKHADLGISVEENKGLNYFYALPNKLFDYIQAEIPVLVSPFPEMKNIVNTYKIGDCIENHHPQHIAEKIKEMLTNEEQIPKWKKNLTFASKELCWELEEKKIFELISNAENFGN